MTTGRPPIERMRMLAMAGAMPRSVVRAESLVDRLRMTARAYGRDEDEAVAEAKRILETTPADLDVAVSRVEWRIRREANA